MRYSDAGVHMDAADEAKRRIKELARRTFNPQVLGDIGLFGGLFQPDLSGLEHPVLVASCDGVGTKLKIAFQAGRHCSVGRDLVAHCVNDILVQGATPLFFLDYIAMGKLRPEVVAEIVEGLSAECQASGCALIGGETAEMPGFYPEGEYDLVGFIVGLVDRQRVIQGAGIRPGDLLIGLPSAGLHTNGYSLARKLFFEVAGLQLNDVVPELGSTAAEALLAVHRNYLPVLREAAASGKIQGMAHVTGGGITENLPRILPEGCQAVIRRESWPVPALFQLLQKWGKVSPQEMYRTFNMGIGIILVVHPEDASAVESQLRSKGENFYRIGEIAAGERRVLYPS
ncbi:MAG: phosphoribosylformylglycinamidine cyclo-ligase [Acidobacteria bacterium]|nr:phosphoribosylformylglycinamidine cyclo-ligase [Acidobacteriota bacterium]